MDKLLTSTFEVGTVGFDLLPFEGSTPPNSVALPSHSHHVKTGDMVYTLAGTWFTHGGLLGTVGFDLLPFEGSNPSNWVALPSHSHRSWEGLVGTAGFEPATSASRTLRAAKLRHVP